jgi:hypothetical protein
MIAEKLTGRKNPQTPANQYSRTITKSITTFMASYYYDFEFIEDFHKPLFGKRRHYIDMISVGIVSSDGREYSAVSNEFDVKKAWNKFELTEDFGKPQGLGDKKDYWLRDNVLQPMIHDLVMFSHAEERKHILDSIEGRGHIGALRWLINKYGKSNEQIANEIRHFVFPSKEEAGNIGFTEYQKRYSNPVFYGYYSAYDHVLLCSLFGKMINLPDGFPMYTRDLRQIQDEKGIIFHADYPKPTGNHNAIADARWIKKLHEFLKLV